MKDTVAYYNALKKWAKMSPDLFATVDLEGFAEKFAETVEKMKADVERLREKKNASDSDTVIPADCEAIEVFDYLTNFPETPSFYWKV